MIVIFNSLVFISKFRYTPYFVMARMYVDGTDVPLLSH